MRHYIVRRVLQMIPTLIGVILLTFVLFNVVGGSPGAVAHGQKASALEIEEFDEERGYNKPLLFGWWTRTRAFDDSRFAENAGAWRDIAGVSYHRPEGRMPGRLTVTGDAVCAVPLAFPLRARESYRFTLRYRLAEPGRAVLALHGPGQTEHRAELAASARWRTARIRFEVPEKPATLRPELAVTNGTLEIREIRLRRRMAHPFDSQFFFFLGRLARLDFGTSHVTNQKVSTMLKEGAGPSLMLTVPILFGGLAGSVSLALVCAWFRNRLLDRLLVLLSVVLMSVNYIVWIIAGQYVLAYKLDWFPVWGFESWRFLVLPIGIWIVSSLGRDLRFYRTIMLEELHKDYVRTAKAKGVGPAGILFRHVLRNAMIPVITNVSMAVPFLFTGSLLLESFFGIPGLGRVGIEGLTWSDFDVVRAVVLIGAVLYLVANLVTDLCYALVDPRVRLQ